jgi:Tol biopolymer transport system component
VYCIASESCEYHYGSQDARIWVMNRDGSHQHQLTNDPSYFDADPSWSPDGHHIVFSRCSNFFFTCDIDVMRADGTHIRTLIAGHWHHGTPAYSPDGSLIAFSSDKGGYDTRVWVARSDGSHPRPITPPALFGSGVNWAPDGSGIFFTGHAFDNGRLWSVKPDGGALHQFTRLPTYSGGYSPDQRKIVAVADFISGCRCIGLVLLNRDGTILRPVVTSERVPNIGGFNVDWGVAP